MKEEEQKYEHPLSEEVDFDVSINLEEKAVQLIFTGFEFEEDVEEYAEFLVKTLPLLLFHSKRIH